MTETDAREAWNDAIPNFSNVKDFEDIQRRFFSAARFIMFHYQLEYDARVVEISSLELYLKLHKQPHVWWDAATDKGADEQFNRATWYVRQKKGPAYWRLDLTAGCRSAEVQAGLLIRALDRNDGPAKALQAIARGGFSRRAWSEDELRRIHEIHGKPIFGDTSSPLRMVRRNLPLQGPCYVGPRINIPKRHNEKNFEGISMRDASLRIATWQMNRRDELQIERSVDWRTRSGDKATEG